MKKLLMTIILVFSMTFASITPSQAQTADTGTAILGLAMIAGFITLGYFLGKGNCNCQNQFSNLESIEDDLVSETKISLTPTYKLEDNSPRIKVGIQW